MSTSTPHFVQLEKLYLFMPAVRHLNISHLTRDGRDLSMNLYQAIQAVRRMIKVINFILETIDRNFVHRSFGPGCSVKAVMELYR